MTVTTVYTFACTFCSSGWTTDDADDDRCRHCHRHGYLRGSYIRATIR